MLKIYFQCHNQIGNTQRVWTLTQKDFCQSYIFFEINHLNVLFLVELELKNMLFYYISKQLNRDQHQELASGFGLLTALVLLKLNLQLVT